jgi:signal transduction histidine kinase
MKPELESFPDPTEFLTNRLFTLLMAVNEKILKGVPYESILDFLFDSLNTIIPYDRIGVALLEKQGANTKLQMDWVKSREKISHLNLPYSTTQISASLNALMETNTPRIIDDLTDYLLKHPNSVATQLIVKDGVRSSLTCPVQFNGRPIGVIFFSSFKTNTYNQEHIEIFKKIAGEISIVVNHGKLQKSFLNSEDQTRNVNMTLHDLKSPLGVLQGFAQFSLEQPWFNKLDIEAKVVFQTFFRNTQYMLQLVNDLSDLTVLRSGNDQCQIKENCLAEFLNEILQAGRQMAQQKEILFKTRLAPTLPIQVHFDAHKIKRVLVNLISNAIKFSNRKTEILFSVTLEDHHLVFSVRDQGQGIPEVEMGKLFHEFGKTSVRPTEGEVSTGQGLAIAKKIIDQHQGEISVHSIAGEGSTFRFWIPLKNVSDKGQNVSVQRSVDL